MTRQTVHKWLNKLLTHRWFSWFFNHRIIKKIVNPETIAYLFFGVLTTILAFVVYALIIFFGAGIVWANTISTIVAVLFAYITNRLWVFESHVQNIKDLIKEFVKFSAMRGVTFVGETLLLVLLVDIWGFDAVIMKLVTLVLVVIANYILSKFVVFNA